MGFNPQKIIRYESLASTNKEAFRLNALRRLDEGTVILARDQFSGRGQGQTSWESEAGKNLTFSLVLRPVFLRPARQFLLNQAIALGIREGIAGLTKNEKFSIKWPNDIYYQDGKVSGMLIETQIMGADFELVVAGIGVNVNQDNFFSDAPNPLSLKNISGVGFDLDLALKACITAIFKWYAVLKDGRFDEINQAYLKHLLGNGKPMKFACARGVFDGVITGVDTYGKLLIENEKGMSQAFDLKEVRFLF